MADHGQGNCISGEPLRSDHEIVPSPSPHHPALQPRLHRKIVIFVVGQPGGANPQNTKQSEPRPWYRLSVLRVADDGSARPAASSACSMAQCGGGGPQGWWCGAPSCGG